MAQREKNVNVSISNGESHSVCNDLGTCLEMPICNGCFRSGRNCHDNALNCRPKKRNQGQCTLLEYIMFCRIPYWLLCWFPVGLFGTCTAGRRQNGQLHCCTVKHGLGCFSQSTCWCVANAVFCPFCVVTHGCVETNPCADCYTAEEIMASANGEDPSYPKSFINERDHVSLSVMRPEQNNL